MKIHSAPRTAQRAPSPAVRLAWLLCLLAALPLTAPAATFPNLYTVTVESDPEALDPRADAIRRGMMQLLTRVSGRRDAGLDPEAAELVANAERYLTSYAELDGGRVRAGFNGTAVTNRLTALDWPLWGAERPATLLWVAIDLGGGQRALLSADEAPLATLSREQRTFVETVEEELRAAADERGLPIVFPLLDLEDYQSIGFAEVWGGFDPLIERASRRYAPDAVLVARVSLSEFGPDVTWRLLRGGQRQLFTSMSLREGIDWLADTFAAEYSSIGGARMTRIDVLGVEDLADYGRIVSYLESVSLLEAVDIERMAGNVLTLRVSARGDTSTLERVLALSSVLEPVAPGGPALPGSAFGPGAALTFRLAGADSERR